MKDNKFRFSVAFDKIIKTYSYDYANLIKVFLKFGQFVILINSF